MRKDDFMAENPTNNVNAVNTANTANTANNTMPNFTESESVTSSTPTSINTEINTLGPSAGQFQNSNPNTWIVQVPQNHLLPDGYTEILDIYNIQYLNGYLRTQIGNYVAVHTLVGNSLSETHEGLLIAVGVNYVILKTPDTEDTTIIDYYTIKSVDVYA